MHKIMIICAAFALSGCGSSEALDNLAAHTPQSACAEFTRSMLNSPSSYQQIDIETWEEPLTGAEMEERREMAPSIGTGTPGVLYVGIEFDAVNEMGAVERSANVCPFSMKDGNVLQTEVDDLVKASEHIRALMNQERTGKDFPIMKEPVA